MEKNPDRSQNLSSAVENLALYATPPTSPAAHRISVFDPPLGRLRDSRTGGMEGDEQQRRQYEQPNYPRGFIADIRGAPSSNVPDPLDHRAGPGDNVSERYRQSQLLTARTPTTSMNPVGGNPQDLGGYGYAQGQQYATPQMQGTPMQYAAEYSQDPQRQQQYQQYTSQMMYNVSPQTQQQSPYDSVPQYQSRQSAGSEVLSSQFGVPQYYNAGETTSAPEPAPIVQQYAPAQFHPPLLYHPSASITQSTLASSYTPGMADLAQPNAPAPNPDEIEAQENSGDFDRAYAQYQEALRQTFENTREGRLVEAGQSLLEISDWLLRAADELGNPFGTKDFCVPLNIKQGFYMIMRQSTVSAFSFGTNSIHAGSRCSNAKRTALRT